MASDLLEMTVDLTKAYLNQNQLSGAEVPEFIRSIHETLMDLRTKRAVSETEAAEVQPSGGLVAPIRDENIDDAAYKGLDPWLAMRISPSMASKLNAQNKPHPTVFQDRIICLEDGKEVKLLRAYLKKNFNLEFRDYVSRWNLPANYPTAPPAYLATKRAIAKKTGLGVTTRAHREKRAAAVLDTADANASGDTAGAEPTRKKSRPAQLNQTKAVGARGARRPLSLFSENKKKNSET